MSFDYVCWSSGVYQLSPRGVRKSFFQFCSPRDVLPELGHLDPRGHRGVAGHHHGHLSAPLAGHETLILSPDQDRPHVTTICWAHLHPARELVAHDRHRRGNGCIYQR